MEKNKNKRWLPLLTATGFGSGFFPIAPGTVGTAVAIPLVFLASQMLFPYVYIGTTIIIFLIGVWSCNYAEEYFGKKDPGHANIDEILGYFVTMFLVPINIKTLILGFFVFRFFDITKIPPVKQVEKVPGGMGIMLDDFLAGLYSLACMHILVHFGGKYLL
jgi:phosphatidylglycerophosphatase A